MSFTGVSNLHTSIDKTNTWLAEIAGEFGTEDQRLAYRVLRAWLHALRDRLPVTIAANFAVQLPELRGVFYDGPPDHRAGRSRTWRKLPPMPEPRCGATAVWDGTEALFIGGTLADAHGPSADGVAFSPATGQWRRLPGMEFSRRGFAAVWTCRQVLVWGRPDGLVPGPEDPAARRGLRPGGQPVVGNALAPLRGRSNPTAVWTGGQMIVWGGTIPGTQKTPRPPTGLPTGPPAAEPQCRTRTPHRVLTCCSAADAPSQR
jgi:Uncharacterized conserved protein (DUF2267)